MSKKHLGFDIETFDSENELQAEDLELLQAAKSSAKRAYAPYSKFNVGAAVRLDTGKIVEGNNQENAAYPSGICAERVAIFYASSHYPDNEVVAIAITAQSDEFSIDYPISPCGACRQVLTEYENKQQKKIRLIMQGETGSVYVIESAKHLLPLTFTQTELGR